MLKGKVTHSDKNLHDSSQNSDSAFLLALLTKRKKTTPDDESNTENIDRELELELCNVGAEVSKAAGPSLKKHST